MKIDFAIGIPTLNRADLLREALRDYEASCPGARIFVIDNGNQGIDSSEDWVSISRPEKNIGVAASWNRLCNSIFNNYEYALIANDDIVLGRKQDDIQAHISANPDTGFFLGEKMFSVFVISRKTYTLVGQFDEKFYPAYFEDNDYSVRMKRAGVKSQVHPLFNPVIFRNSMTSHKDPGTNSGYMKNREYYISKWGGLPGEEVYLTPFNE